MINIIPQLAFPTVDPEVMSYEKRHFEKRFPVSSITSGDFLAKLEGSIMKINVLFKILNCKIFMIQWKKLLKGRMLVNHNFHLILFCTEPFLIFLAIKKTCVSLYHFLLKTYNFFIYMEALLLKNSKNIIFEGETEYSNFAWKHDLYFHIFEYEMSTIYSSVKWSYKWVF